jgi:nitroreductase
MENIIDSLKWRYATKEYDATKKLSPEQLNLLLESLRLSPSSFGMQPWKFVLVNNAEVRAKLREAAWGQTQVTDASHLIVISVLKNVDENLIKKYIKVISEVRGVSEENLKGFEDMMIGAVNMKSPEARIEWATRQAYIALGVLLTTAAHEQIDATPMEGFDPKKFDEILGLDKMGLESKVMVALGFRSQNDGMANVAKVRFPMEDVVVEIK